jgi:surfactin synthase thioesterase subunit
MRLELRNRLEARLELQIATSLLAQFPEVGLLSARLAADLDEAHPATASVASAETATLSSRAGWIGLTAGGAPARARLFCVPGAGASSSFFRAWTREVPAGLDLCVVELPGHGLRLGEPTLSSVEETAAQMLEALAPVMAEMPFAIFGHSMGGLISYELIRKAAARGLAPVHLFVSSAAPPDWPATVSKRLKGLSDAEFLELCRQEGFISSDIDRAHDAELARSYVPVIRGDFLMAESFDRRNLTAIDVPISAVAARGDSMVSAQLMEGWARFSTGRFAIDVVDGDHFSARGQGAVFLGQILAAFGDGLRHRNRRSEPEPSLVL